MASKSRAFSIDILRAVSIIGVMVIHSLALFLGPTAINQTWNYLEFVVITFVFCSGYVTWLSFTRGNIHLVPWYKKRFVRLYVPYLLYAGVYIVLHKSAMTTPFILSSVFLTGGVDVGWLALLFLQLALVTPLLVWIAKDAKKYTIALFVTAIFALVTIFLPISSSYSRAIAWFPWSFIYLLGMGIAKFDLKRNKHIFICLAPVLQRYLAGSSIYSRLSRFAADIYAS